jgi:cytochrome b
VITGKIGGLWIDWHGRIGQLILGLVVFRLAWGLVGSTHARFAAFIPGPAALRAYLTGRWSGVGHNPIGALSVLMLLATVAAQAIAGLFANDDITFSGPLAALVDKDRSDALTGFHGTLVNLLLALVTLHVAAIGYYARRKGQNLLLPMITGDKTVPPPLAEPARGGGTVAFLAALALAAGLVAIVGSGTLSGWLAPTPATPPAAATPAW